MDDLCLKIEPMPDHRGCSVQMVHCRDGTPVASTNIPPPNTADLRNRYLAAMRRLTPEQFPQSLIQELGEHLASILFPEPILQALRLRLDEGVVRLRVQVGSDLLASLPWEYAYVPSEGFLCLHPNLRLVRSVSIHADSTFCPPDTLCVLVVSANPDTPGYPALPAVAQEVSEIHEALLARPVLWDYLDSATPAALRHRLNKPPAPHIVHFVGHSDARPSGAFLVLQGTEPGAESLVFADEFAEWLPTHTTGLVVLASCLSAGSAQGIAETLSRAGVPAVIAMQTRFRDQTAPLFARAFYTALIGGESVDGALHQARRALQAQGANWGAPALFLNGTTEVLFNPISSEGAGAEAATSLPFKANPDFVGRQSFLTKLHHVLSGTTPVALVGLPGIGKTQVAMEYARAFASSYPGGVFWLDASRSRRLIEQYASLASLLGEDSSSHTTRERAQAVKERLGSATSRTLAVLDNLSESTEPSWIPRVGECQVLVTTRRPHLVQEGYRVMQVPPLDEDAALLLLQSRHEAQSETELQSARCLVRLVGGLPLALSLIASHVARLHCSFESYLNQVRNPLDTLRQARYTFQSATGHDGSIYDALFMSYNALSKEAQRTLHIAASLNLSSVSMGLLKEIYEETADAPFEETVSELEEITLASSMPNGRLWLHELVRLFVDEHVENPVLNEHRARACGVLAQWFAQANAQQRWQSVREETDTARALLSRVRDLAPFEERGALLAELATTLAGHGQFDEAVPLLEKALEEITALYPDEPMRAALCMRRLGYICEQARLPEKALQYVMDALDTAKRFLPPSSPEMVDYLTTAGYVLKMTGKFTEAQEYYEQALQQAMEVYGHEHPSVASILNNLGTLHEAQGDLQTAMDRLREAQGIDERLYGRVHVRVAVRLNNIGRVLAKTGQYLQAVQCHQEAAAIYEKALGNTVADVGESLVYLGDALRGMRDMEGARVAYCRALDIFERVYRRGHPDIQTVRRRLETL